MEQKIKNVFVLVLENRSFDHMLGYSKIEGIDAVTGQSTKIEGLIGNESNNYDGKVYTVSESASYTMPFDPGHEFTDVVEQLSGKNATYPKGDDYPLIDNSGFVENYATTKSEGEGGATDNLSEIMKCYSPEDLPVMIALAKEFAVCDHWFSSMPGPTWPNRFFIMGASSNGLDDSPTSAEIGEWMSYNGFKYGNGSLFDLLKKYKDSPYRIYKGDKGPFSGSFPIAASLKGIKSWDVENFSNFQNDISKENYPWAFTFIEPNYGDVINNSYKGGTSQHPMDDVRNGELLIKETYEAIRNSPHWDNSLLIITYDEHGGFYDHVSPPMTIAPGDDSINSSLNKHGFNFKQLGVRVPTIVISPYIPKNTIDHRVYEHSSIPSTVENIFDLPSLTLRDGKANNLSSLLKLSTPRTDTPTKLPNPIKEVTENLVTELTPSIDNMNPIPKGGNLAGFLYVAMKAEKELNELQKGSDEDILFSVQDIKTYKDASEYFTKVHAKLSSLTKII